MKILAPFLFLAACGGAAAPAVTVERPAPLPAPPVTVSAPPPAKPTFEGSYLLDNDATLASMESEFAKMPQDQRDAAREMARSLFERMKVTLELRAGGTLEIRSSIAGETDPTSKKDKEEGTWQETNDGITVTSKGKEMHCTKSGVRLTCEQTPPSREGALVFVQQR